MSTRLSHSLRTRLALLASFAMLAVILVACLFSILSIRGEVADIRTHDLSGKAVRVLLEVKRERLPPVLDQDGLDGIQVVNAAGKPVSSTPSLAGQPRQVTSIPRGTMANDTAELCDLPAFPGQCKLVVALIAFQPDGPWVVYAFDPAVPWYVSIQMLLIHVGVVMVLVALTWIGVSHVVSRTLTPVGGITARLSEMSMGRSDVHIPVPESDDEIRDLAETANRTLERLHTAMKQQESAMELQRRFAADASHDLRSPITAMRAQVEEALLHPEDADWREVGGEVLASLDRLQAIVTDLLTLNKLDAHAPAERVPVDIAELVTNETMRQRGKPVRASLQEGVFVMGSPLQLARLLVNLLDNAERHAEREITVVVRREGGDCVLEVLDDGAGIAPDQREAVFQRFTRLDASRSRDAGGTGLGLPIAREIAHAHGGTLTIEDSDVGARFVLRIPCVSGPAP
ncbi:sensor histidine kinase [Nonomuraea maritima]|uniref:sensor histidine kinase n=1 Tax=Nonomuraea maritima TaxID=683260 RepID=UPI001FDF22C4|nr:HAMP domain-containing sensor histidine kinase [Nonomuraea maritima]